ncbi:MAG: hydroxymethylbilane synthase [Bernardetiaceae bacterium]
MEPLIKIGTRSSELALWQANHVSQLLYAQGLACEIVPIETKGDKILSKTIAKIGGKGVFTQELEEQLLSGDVHLAVHSAKDVPSSVAEAFEILAFTERESPRDVVVSYNKDFRLDSERPWVVGTSSTRRVAMLKHYYPHVRTVNIRGNIQTRMRKLDEGHCDALILAEAGVERMDYDAYITQELDIDEFTPAVGQGALAVEISRNLDPELRKIFFEATNDASTATCLYAERAFLSRIEGGCAVPVFGYACLDRGELYMRAGVISLNGKQIVRCERRGDPAEARAIGTALAEEVLRKGGKQILDRIKGRR